MTAGFRQLTATFHKLRRLRMTFLFLLAYWCYIDGVDTIVLMAVDYGLSIGFDANNLMLALLITQFVGFPAALLFGRLGESSGPKQGIMLAIFVYLGILLWAYRMESIWEFYLLAVAIGLVQGGIQALSRALFARLIPRDQAGEFFGFYNMLGKFAVVLGPVLMGWVGVADGRYPYLHPFSERAFRAGRDPVEPGGCESGSCGGQIAGKARSGIMAPPAFLFPMAEDSQQDRLYAETQAEIAEFVFDARVAARVS